jgi:hypothetical protein
MNLFEEDQEEIVGGREATVAANIEKERGTETLAHARGRPNNAVLTLIHTLLRDQVRKFVGSTV